MINQAALLSMPKKIASSEVHIGVVHNGFPIGQPNQTKPNQIYQFTQKISKTPFIIIVMWNPKEILNQARQWFQR